jgi:hypothetical protein
MFTIDQMAGQHESQHLVGLSRRSPSNILTSILSSRFHGLLSEIHGYVSKTPKKKKKKKKVLEHRVNPVNSLTL